LSTVDARDQTADVHEGRCARTRAVRVKALRHGQEARDGNVGVDETSRAACADRRKPNVLLLTSFLGIGGAEVVVRDLARHLDRHRFNVSVCCLKALGPAGLELAAEGVDISVLPKADLDRVDYFSALQLRRVLRDKRIDVVHSHTTHALVDAAVCRCLSRSVKVVHTFHFGNYPHQPGRTLLMEGIASRLVDRLVAVGEVQREWIQQTYRLSDRAISAVRNGVHVPQFLAGDPAFRRSICAQGKILVGTIAHLCPQKGLHDLLAVARRVRDVRTDVHFVVVGGGDLRGALERRRHDLGLDDAMTFTGLLTNAASRALPSFDIYVQTSRWEAMSISILEAMAAGKSVVSTNVGEVPHLIEEGAEGFLYNPGDVEGIASAILTLAQDRRLRRQTGEAAARKIAQRFTLDHMIRAYEEMYLDVLQSDQGRAVHALR
jgi:glycosyltransferase involved in cell wall biosynthesis